MQYQVKIQLIDSGRSIEEIETTKDIDESNARFIMNKLVDMLEELVKNYMG